MKPTLDLAKLRSAFEKHLDHYMMSLDAPLEMIKPMLYSLQGGGKRLRPLLLLAVIQIQDPERLQAGMSSALALEYIHTYSLIHDDLPAMDDDELRRGQPTSHIQFDEATAILAGDALVTDAFGLIAEDESNPPALVVQLLNLLSKAAGSVGMVAGQLKDMQAEDQEISYEALKQIHQLKTGCLFTFAIQAGALIAGMEPSDMKVLLKFAYHYGVAYQIHNDLADVLADSSQTGKTQNHDQAIGKSTYPGILGLERALRELDQELAQGKKALEQLSRLTGKPFSDLSIFLDFIRIDQTGGKA
ncbi:polyprenyl synthetase family protein [Hutsoniella sourekii]|uniref:polyprenyl synthetase family protein n=1 Tax=Hutsoniella sourekii TaxID=87650 RepID=UPI00047FBCC5|nr:farnesyl diphosphate synthase [Hutsoniella sourekii]